MPLDLQLSALEVASQDYFEGERLEMYLILLGAVAATGLAGALFWTSRDAFARGLLMTVAACATLLTGTALSLLHRDSGLRTSIASQVRSGAAGDAAISEKKRVDLVIAKYAVYRYVAVTIAIVAVGGLLLRTYPTLQGVATGLLMLVVAQVVIDHYSERRARIYSEGLQARQTVPPTS